MNHDLTRAFKASTVIPVCSVVGFTGGANEDVTVGITGNPKIGVTVQAYTAAEVNDVVDVQLYGIAKVRAGGNIPVGSKVGIDGAGRAIVWASGQCLGVAVTGLSIATGNEIIEVLLHTGV